MSETVFENCKWIWAEDIDSAADDIVIFRRPFKVEKPPKKAVARIAAENRYFLCVNGKEVVIDGGMLRSSRMGKGYYDEVDLSSYIEKGDPYPEHIKNHIYIINKMTGIKSFETAYQSKVGPVKWMQPAMIDILESYKDKNIDNIIIVPISFISDHIETLIELDEQLMPILKNAGKNIVRIESLNDSPDFIEALSDVINI